MCLITAQKEPIILKKDKIVYKMLRDMQMSTYHLFYWKPEQLYETEIKHSDRGSIIFADTMSNQYYRYKTRSCALDTRAIVDELELQAYGQGFHFSVTKGRLKEFYIDTDYGESICKFKIPAGAEVYYDETGLGVTNQIMMM